MSAIPASRSRRGYSHRGGDAKTPRVSWLSVSAALPASIAGLPLSNAAFGCVRSSLLASVFGTKPPQAWLSEAKSGNCERAMLALNCVQPSLLALESVREEEVILVGAAVALRVARPTALIDGV